MATQFENGLTLSELAERNAELVTEVEKLRAERDASLNAERVWEKTMMEVCGEDGPVSVASEIRSLQALRDTAMQALKSQVEQLAAENVALKSFGDKLNDMHNALNGEGTGIQGRAEVACQQVALEAAMEEFDAIETPATDAVLTKLRNEAGARAVELFAKTLGSPYRFRDEQCYEDGFTRAIEIVRFAQAPLFARQLREGTDK
ncbi:TPA: hypothetical protein N3N81_004758 [Klebsiella variicola subsp. variicola]|nr:hypothetical protein [Klebsiella variicola subsp. variicola]HCM5370393.1 hypothetical protein [Klebsiella variicola subsp. variicola]